MAYAPVPELKALRAAPTIIPAGNVNPGDNPLAGVKGDSLDVEAEIKPGTAKSVVFNFRGVDVTYDAAKGEVGCNHLHAPVTLDHGILKLRILLDRTTLDIFAENGLVYVPLAILPPISNQSESLTAVGGSAEIVSLKVYPMQSSWTP